MVRLGIRLCGTVAAAGLPRALCTLGFGSGLLGLYS